MLSFSQTILKSIIFLFAGTILVLHPSLLFGFQSEEIGIVMVKNLNLRSEPEKNSPPLKMLKKGTKVKILKHCSGWLYILHEGHAGYIRNKAQYVEIITERKEKVDSQSRPGQSWPEMNIERFKKEAENIGRKIKKCKKEVLAFTEEETAIINNLNEIDLALNTARKRVSVFTSELAALEKKIKKTSEASETLKKKIKISENYASKRLVALYKLNRIGRMHILASADSIFDFFRKEAALKRILSYDENILENLAENKIKLQETLEKLNKQKTKIRILEKDYNKQIKQMCYKREERAKVLADIRNKKSLEMAAIESLKLSGRDLDEKIKSLGENFNPPKQDKKILPKTFISLKGLLNMPVKGKIVSYFGPYKNTKFNVLNFRSGIDIKAERGEPIRAVCGGKILYASWFKGYGNMIIIDHGDKYYTLYAHAEELFKAKGDTVETDEVIATVGDTGSMIGPKLHFEVRYHGKPIDPVQWIKKG